MNKTEQQLNISILNLVMQIRNLEREISSIRREINDIKAGPAAVALADEQIWKAEIMSKFEDLDRHEPCHNEEESWA